MYTLDTNAIIYHLKDDEGMVVFFEKIFESGFPLYVSTITEVELFGFSLLSQGEAEAVTNFLTTVVIIPLDSRIARIAGSLRRQYGIKIADSVIAATALITHTTLVTRNVKDFKKVDGLVLEGL